jgi:hypothetical protein
VLGRWTFFFCFKGQSSSILQKIFCCNLSELLVMWERIGEALKMVYSAYQFAETWYKRQYECAMLCSALHGIFLV